jgi:hypothetical protein
MLAVAYPYVPRPLPLFVNVPDTVPVPEYVCVLKSWYVEALLALSWNRTLLRL